MTTGNGIVAVANMLIGTALCSAVAFLLYERFEKKRLEDELKNTFPKGPKTAYERLIGNTPMIRLETLSNWTRRNIYVKMESLNPGGTGKDRAALRMIQQAEADGSLPPPIQEQQNGLDSLYLQQSRPFSRSNNVESNNKDTSRVQKSKENGSSKKSSSSSSSSRRRSLEEAISRAMQHSQTGGLVVEGTSGSTGISLATLSAVRGHACLVVMPDDQATEKRRILETLGAVVHVVPNAAISNPQHYVNVARRMAKIAREKHGIQAVFMDQFENPANYKVHFDTTGPEILRQCPQINAFIMSSGTGGTIAGVGLYLKKRIQRKRKLKRHIKIVLADPPGSALFNRIRHGVAYASQQREQHLRRHRYDTLAEGIGLDRMTFNFSRGVSCIDDAIRVTDQEAVDMAHWLLANEGLWVGSSSAMNIVAAVRTALSLPTGSHVVTMVCDGGQRHVTRFWNASFINSWGLEWPAGGNEEEKGTASQGQQQRLPDCLRSCYTMPN